MTTTAKMSFSVLLRKEGDEWTAHCLELDIVATGDSEEAVTNDLFSLI